MELKFGHWQGTLCQCWLDSPMLYCKDCSKFGTLFFVLEQNYNGGSVSMCLCIVNVVIETKCQFAVGALFQ